MTILADPVAGHPPHHFDLLTGHRLRTEEQPEQGGVPADALQLRQIVVVSGKVQVLMTARSSIRV
jgi:hypothetical protein